MGTRAEPWSLTGGMAIVPSARGRWPGLDCGSDTDGNEGSLSVCC